ncbi:phage tail tape measure protein [Paenibacillus caseinilyticus]|uniref:Phage tail tape measure protein domain-containing protein n=1 Tax=Paenibacillus mucilaginosus K02 TaxID=997761 RepID=R9UL85_9BACL|nr:phage tail tape measure protein [Paenibacillus mucilaginosus]AGN70604.1 hypothetical protein B2K_38775 [Paenibacillus mucilaginosus K02]
MAEEEAGSVVVKVGMDGTGFQNGISNINRQLRLIQSEFAAASAKLGDFGNSAEGLKLQSDALSKQMSLQQQKVDALQKAYEKAAESKGKDAKATQELEIKLNKAKEELTKTEKKLESVNEEIEKQNNRWNKLSNTLNDIRDRFQAVGDQLSGIGGMLSATLTTALVGIGVGAIGAASDVDKSAGKMQASLGLAAEEADNLSTRAQNLWKDAFGESMEDVTQGLITVKQNMQGLDDGSLEKVTKDAFTLRDAFGAEVNETTRTASVLMKNFGIDGSTAMDLITVGFQKGGNFSDELLDTMREYAPQFRAMGIGAEDMLGILIKGAETGAFNLDKVGDALKEFNIRAKDGSELTSQAFTALGFNADGMSAKFAAGGETGKTAFQAVTVALAGLQDPLTRNAIGVALFGTQWEDLEAKVVTSMATGIGSVTGFQGATQRAGDALRDNLGVRATKVWREFQTALQPLGEMMIGLAEDILPQVSAAVQSLTQWFSNLSPGGQKLTVVLAAIAAAVGPVVMIVAQLVGAISTLAGAFSAASGAIAAAGGVMAVITGPIGITIASIASLAAGAYLVVKNWDQIKSVFSRLGSWLSSYFSNLVNTVTTYGQFIMAGLMAGINSKLQPVINMITAVANGITGAFRRIMGIRSPSKVMEEYGQYIDEGLVQGMASGQDSVLEQTQSIADGIKQTMEKNIGMLNKLGEAIVGALRKQYEEMESIQTAALDKQLENEKKASDERQKVYDKEYAEKLKLIDEETYNKVKAVQDQIDSIDSQTSNEEKALKAQEQQTRLAELQKKIAAAETAEERARLQEELSSTIAKYEREQLLEQRNNQKEALKKQIEGLKEASAEQKELLKADLDSKKEQEKLRASQVEESLKAEKDAVKKHFDELTTQENLQLEARKLVVDKNNQEIVDLLQKYNPSWQNAAQSFADSLINGLNSEKQSIADAVGKTIDLQPMVQKQMGVLDELQKKIASLQQAEKAEAGAGGSEESPFPDSGGFAGGGGGDIGGLGAAADNTSAKLEGLMQTTATLQQDLTGNFVPSVQGISGAWNEVMTSSSNVWGQIAGYLTQTWTSISSNAQQVWSGVTGFFTSAWNSFLSVATSVSNSIHTGVTGTWNNISAHISSVVSEIVGNVMTIFGGMSGGISTVFSGIESIISGSWAIIKNVTLGSILLLLDLVTFNFTELTSHAGQIWENLRTAFRLIWDGIQQVFTGALETLKGGLAASWGLIKTDLIQSWNEAEAYLSTLWVNISAQASTGWTDFKTSVTKLVEETISSTRTKWDELLTWFGELPEKLKGYAESMFRSMRDGFNNTVNEVTSAVRTGLDGAFDFIKKLPEEALQWGKDIIEGLIKGIRSAIGSVKAAMDSVASTVKGSITGALGIRSPSRVMMEYGGFTTEGFALGIKGGLSRVASAARTIASAAFPKVELPNMAAPAGRTAVPAASSGGFVQNITINSPQPLSPAETARLNLRASRQLAMGWGLDGA